MDTMGFMSASSARPYAGAPKRVTSSDLHKDTRSALNLLRSNGEVAVTHYNEVEGFLVSPSRLRELKSAASHAEEVRTALPMVLAAAVTGVAIPSETLDRLMPGQGDNSWRAVAEFAARYPVTLHAGEDGEPITRARLRVIEANLDETGTDEELNLD